MCYFNKLFEKPRETINAICLAVNDPMFDRPNHLVGIGLSGAIPLMAVSMQTGLPFSVIRKDGYKRPKRDGGSHSTSRIEPEKEGRIDRYLIIDDQVETGRTIEFIKEVTPGQCVGIVLYEYVYYEYHNDVPLICVANEIREAACA